MAWTEPLTQNILLIFYTIVVIIILAIIAKVISIRERAKERKELANLQLESKKLDMVKKEKELEDLKEASMVLNDHEKKRIDKIERDKAVLSRRSIALMNEIEERMQRLERGADNAKLMKTMKDIRRAEDELFGKEEKP